MLSAALQGPVADDSTYDLAGLFVQSETPLHHRLDLLLGGRYAYARADAPRVENPNSDEPLSVSGNWNAIVGTARLTYALDAPRSTFLYAGVAQGFRAPNLSNLTRFDTARTDEIETPVEDLDPEYYLTGEVGLKAISGPLSGQLAYSYTRIDGMIIRPPPDASSMRPTRSPSAMPETATSNRSKWIFATASGRDSASSGPLHGWRERSIPT